MNIIAQSFNFKVVTFNIFELGRRDKVTKTIRGKTIFLYVSDKNINFKCS